MESAQDEGRDSIAGPEELREPLMMPSDEDSMTAPVGQHILVPGGTPENGTAPNYGTLEGVQLGPRLNAACRDVAEWWDPTKTSCENLQFLITYGWLGELRTSHWVSLNCIVSQLFADRCTICVLV